MEISLSLDRLIPKIFALFLSVALALSSSPWSVRGKKQDLPHWQFICNKNETHFNALMAKEAETCHKYKIKQAENFTGITNGLLLAQRPQLTAE